MGIRRLTSLRPCVTFPALAGTTDGAEREGKDPVKHISRAGPSTALGALLALLWTAGALAQGKPKATPTTAPAAAGPNIIIKVGVAGQKYRSAAAILADVHIRPGQPYDKRAVEKDVERMIKTLRYDSVSTKVERTAKGVTVTFHVVERPVIAAVRFEGNKAIRTKDLAKVVTINPGDPVDEYLINSGKRAIKSRYRAEGFYKVKVEHDAKALAQRREVVYKIREGPKAYLKKIRFKGNKAFTDFRLRRVIESRARFWPFVAGTLDLETVDRDAVDLRNFYQGEGYLDAQVASDISYVKAGAVVTFVIQEGPRYRIRKTTFQGATIFAPQELRKHLKVVDGAFYSTQAVQRDVRKVQQLYGEIGYINAAVSVKTVRTGKPGEADMVYTIREGRQFRVGRVDIRGNTITKDNVIRRQLQFRPQQLYNTVAVEDSRRRLLGSRLFQSVSITPVGTGPGSRDAVVEVKETRTGFVAVGVGVSSNAGLIGNIQLVERNFDLLAWPQSWKEIKSGRAWRGAGQVLRINAEPGVRVSRFGISWREPMLFDLPYSLETSSYLDGFARETYDENRFGGVVSLGHLFPNRWYGYLSGRVEGVRVDGIDTPKAPPDVVKVRGTTALLGIKGTVVRDTRDSVFLPSKGDRLALSYEQVVGDFNFGKTVVDYRRYYTVYLDALERKHILAMRAATGFLFADAPVFERFYGGGLGSLRGFRFRGISPRQGAYRQVIGGDFMVFLGAEYTFPIIKRLRGVIFLDSGTVESDVKIEDYRISAGFGIQLYMQKFSPLLTLHFGFPISKTGVDDTQLVSFSLGLVF